MFWGDSRQNLSKRFRGEARTVTSLVPSIGSAMEGMFRCVHGRGPPQWNTRAKNACITEKSELHEACVAPSGNTQPTLSLRAHASSGAQCDATRPFQTTCQPTDSRGTGPVPERVPKSCDPGQILNKASPTSRSSTKALVARALAPSEAAACSSEQVQPRQTTTAPSTE